MTTTDSAARRPVDHASPYERKTSRQPASASPRLERDEHGVWQVRGFEEARAVLRSTDAHQAGFGADQIERMPSTMRPPVLHLEGEAHRELRTATARFFTPTTTDQHYRELMERLADELVADLVRAGRADLSGLSMRMATAVAARIVGLDAGRPGLSRRIERLAKSSPATAQSRLERLWAALRAQWSLLSFFVLDVRPAVNKRRKHPQDDVISHVLSKGYSSPEVLSECVTYGAAGVLTTREFIVAATWHLLERPALRARYLIASEPERHAILGEVLRLEPVVGALKRRAARDLEIESEGRTVRIPAGSRIEVHLYAANADEATVGACPHAIAPDRALPRGVQPSVVGFGDGHHRCPGSFVALQETDTFLRKLLALPNLRLERAPRISWNETIEGYELRQFVVSA